MKFAIVPDLHLVAPPERLWGLDPYARFDACLADIAAWHDDVAFCVIMGDLADRGEIDAYRALMRRLETFAIETELMIGNHDDRATFQRAFPDAAHDDNGFVQFARRTDDAHLVFLDTVKEGTAAGALCEQRRAWLADRLAVAGDQPVYLFMHHPPFDINVPYLDRIKLEDAELFAEIVEAAGNVKHIFFAHVHRPVHGVWRGIPASALPALNHQVPLVRGSVETRYSDEPPMYAIVEISQDSLMVNADCYLNRGPCVMPPNKS